MSKRNMFFQFKINRINVNLELEKNSIKGDGNMIRKLLATSLASILVFSTVVPVYAETQPTEDSEEKYIDITQNINQEEMYQIAEKAQDYFILEADGTISIDASAEELETTPELLNQYKNGLESINLAIEQGYLKANNDFSLSSVDKEQPTIQPRWIWYTEFAGTYFQLSNNEAEELVYKLNQWGQTSTGAGVISAYLASKGVSYAAGGALISGLLAVGLFSSANEIEHQIGRTHGVTIFVSNWSLDIIQVSPL